MSSNEDYFVVAEEYKMEGKLGKAIEQYQQISEKDPDNIRALMNLGRLYYMLGHMKKSIEAYEKVAELKPDYFFALYRLGNFSLSCCSF